MSDVPSLDTWREAFSVFERLVALDGAARDRELSALEQDRPDLHEHVKSLLNAGPQTQAQALINAEAIGSAGMPGAQFGAYRLESLIGSGGMGEVWLASRADGLFEGRAAVKLLHPYLSSSRVRERFAREGQILGRLSHPHIARLLDAGTGASGALYLVLEHVEGSRIDHWCDARELGMGARVRLFLQVCQAVAYAHAHLIVHRDLKPSNVLVDAGGDAKLLDFGIAKLLEQEPADAELTRLGGLALTPEYAAPEQLSGEPVSTATDVYALGLMLYVLLTGRHPFADSLSHPLKLQQALAAGPAPLASQSAAGITAAAAGLRSATPPQLARALRGDLDNILAKALRATPAKRYASVLELAEDLRRHLEHEPVLARPESLAYRTRKFVRRHWVGVTAAGAVAASLLVAVAGVAWQARIARLEAAKATAVKDFLVGIFEQSSSLNPDGAAARKITAEELLDQGAQRIRSQLQEVPEVRVELLDIIGRLYQSLLVKDRSLALREEALAAARAHYRSDRHPRVLAARVALATAYVDGSEVEKGHALLVGVLRDMELAGDTRSKTRAAALLALAGADYMLGAAENPRARGYALEALELLRRHHGGSDAEIEALTILGNIEEFGDHEEAAESWYQKALALAENSRDATTAASLHRDYGDLLRRMGRLEDAERHLKTAYSALQRATGAGSTLTADAQVQLAKLYLENHRAQEALPLLTEAVAAISRNHGPRTGRASDALLELGNAQLERGLVLEADRSLQLAADARRDLADGINNRASVLVRQLITMTLLQRWSEAELALAECRRIILDVYGEGSAAHGVVSLREAELRLAQQRWDEAEAMFREILRRWPPADGEFPPSYVKPHWNLAEIEIRRGQAGAAQARLRPLLQALQQSPQRSRLGDLEANTAFYLGWALQSAGRPREALSLLLRGLRWRRSHEDPASLWLARPQLVQASTLLALGRAGEATQALREAGAILDRYPKLAPAYLELHRQVRAQLDG